MSHIRFTLAFFLFSTLFVAGCELGRSQDEEVDCETLGTPEKMISECEGVCVALATHTYHCGACGQSCDDKEANDCRNGRCSCVSSNGSRVSDACDPPSVCDDGTGLCLTPDPFGEPCDEIENNLCDDPSKVCVDSFCTVPDCDHPEICDLLDNDCNGWLDELPNGEELLGNCYSGPPETADIGICRSGFKICVAGSWTPCEGEQLPVAEIGLLACDGQDNDCDDCIDGRIIDGALVCGVRPIIKMDFTFKIDISGSMSDNISATKMAIDSFGDLYESALNLRWSIERVSVQALSTLIDVYHALSDFLSFQTALASLSVAGGGGIEPTYDAVWMTATGEFDVELGVDPTATPVYVVFTDEVAQTLLDLTEAEVCAAVNAKNAVLVVFTFPAFYTNWDECAILYQLSSNSAMMTDNLEDLFDSVVCGI